MRASASTVPLALTLQLVAAFGASMPLAAQPAAPAAQALFDTWITAVQRHAPGAIDDALIVAAGWGDGDLTTIAMYAHAAQQLVARPAGPPTAVALRVNVPGGLAPRALALSGDDAAALRARIEAAGELAPLLQRAILLHGDVAMLGPSRIAPMTGAPPAGVERLRVQLGDGQQVLMDRLSAHWGMARALVDRLPAGDADWSRRWYRATVAFVQSKSQFDGMQVGSGLRRFPDDPLLLFFSACEHEAYASPQIQALIQAAPAPQGMRYVMQAAGPELATAERLFRHALERDPSLVEARVRLARVLRQRGRLDEAASLLRTAVAAPLESAARLLRLPVSRRCRGGPRPRRRRAAAYHAAARLMPTAQSPHLALAGLERRAGRRDAALAEMTALLEPVRDRNGADPWWAYIAIQGRDAEARMLDVRRPFTGSPR